MTDTIRMRRTVAATLVLTAILTLSPAGGASAKTTGGDGTSYDYVSKKVCPINWREGTWYVKQMVRCAAARYGVSIDKALHVARRESLFRPRAYNASSCAKGIYQHLCRYWPRRAYDYGFRHWSAYNARANIIVSMKMVKRYGWRPWGG